MSHADNAVTVIGTRHDDVFAGDFTIAPTHPALPGHFPGHPIVPGVVLLDAAVTRIAAACGATQVLRDGFEIVSAKFLSPVVPGERVDVRFQLAGPAGRTARFTLKVAQRVVASGTLSLATPGTDAAGAPS